jgi:hypothetical protein
MEVIRSSEMSGATQRTTRRHIPDDTLQLMMLIRGYKETLDVAGVRETYEERCPKR